MHGMIRSFWAPPALIMEVCAPLCAVPIWWSLQLEAGPRRFLRHKLEVPPSLEVPPGTNGAHHQPPTMPI